MANAPAPQRRIVWTLWATWADGSRSLLDMLDWEPGYNSTARDAWRYAWGVFRAWRRDPEALSAVDVSWTVEGR